MQSDELDFDGLALIAGGHTAFQLLWAGVQKGVFDVLAASPGLDKAEIGRRVSLAPQPTRVLLTGLSALRLIVREGAGYRNSSIVQQLLVRDSPQNMIDVLGWQAHIVYPGEIDFLPSLEQNTNVGLRRFPGTEDNLYERLAHDPQLEKAFHDAMSSLSRSANALLARSLALKGVRHLVDAGGGDATNAIALARANPHLRVTIFDAPSVCERARSNIAASGFSDRLDTWDGDFFVRDFPPGADAVLFAHMMTIWSLEKDTLLLRRAYDALPASGRVIIFNMMGNDDENGPMTAALGSPYFLSIATGEGMLYSWREYERCMAAAGFLQTERHVLPRDHGVLVGIK